MKPSTPQRLLYGVLVCIHNVLVDVTEFLSGLIDEVTPVKPVRSRPTVQAKKSPDDYPWHKGSNDPPGSIV